MEPIWRARPWPEPVALRALAEAVEAPPLVAAALWARGFRDPADLSPPLTLWPFPGIERAARAVVRAIRENKRIRVHGDYDADGITGTAVLVKGLEALGARVHAYIPRREEGYGVSPEKLAEHAEAADLFITVDCGITNHAELKSLVEDGLEVVVTDHHTPGETPPPGIVVHPAFDPRLENRPQPTGSGMAFFLLWQVHALLGLEPPLAYADLAAVGTIADVAPLLGINRALVQEGLRRIRRSPHLGLRLLAERHLQKGTAIEVAFRIAPRINAAGRLGEPETALKLLLTEDLFEAQALVERLDRLNRERQQIEEAMLARLLPTLNPEDPAHVIHDPEGHPGVMGIVASRIVEATHKPVFIVVGGKGSVRSVPGVSAVAALRAAREALLGFGGHRQAAGFTLDMAEFDRFKALIHAYVRAQEVPPPELWLDGPLFREEMGAVYEALTLLEPLGEGNPEPLFYFKGRPENLRPLAGGRHVKFSVRGVPVIKWRDDGAGLAEEVELAVRVTLNEFNGSRSLELVAEAYRRPGRVQGAGEAWAENVPLKTALELVRAGVPAYAEGEGRAWLAEQGARLAPPEEAGVWFSVPSRPVRREGVRVGLGERTQRALLETEDPLHLAYAKRLVWAYRVGDAALFSEALLGYMHASQDAAGLAPLPGPPAHP